MIQVQMPPIAPSIEIHRESVAAAISRMSPSRAYGADITERSYRIVISNRGQIDLTKQYSKVFNPAVNGYLQPGEIVSTEPGGLIVSLDQVAAVNTTKFYANDMHLKGTRRHATLLTVKPDGILEEICQTSHSDWYAILARAALAYFNKVADNL